MRRLTTHGLVAVAVAAGMLGSAVAISSSAVADAPDNYLEIATRNGSGGAQPPGSLNKAVSLFQDGEPVEQQFWASSHPWKLGTKAEDENEGNKFPINEAETLLVQPIAGEPGVRDPGVPFGCEPFNDEDEDEDVSTAVFVDNGLAVKSTRSEFDDGPQIPLSSPFRGQLAQNVNEKNRLAKNIGTYECLQLGLGPSLDGQLMTGVSFTARENPRWSDFDTQVRVEAFLGDTQQACESQSLNGTQTLSFFDDAGVVFDTLVFGSGSCEQALPGIRGGEAREINDGSGAGYNIALNSLNESVEPLTIALTPALVRTGVIAPGDQGEDGVFFDTSDQGVNVQSQVDFPAAQPDLPEDVEGCNVDDENLIGYTLSHENISGTGPTLDYVFSAEWIVPAPGDVLAEGGDGEPDTLVGNCLFEWTTTMLGTGDLTPLIDYDGDTGPLEAEPVPPCIPLTVPTADPLAYNTANLLDEPVTVQRPLTETEAKGKSGLSCFVQSVAGSFPNGDDGLIAGKQVKILIWNDPKRFG